MQKAAQAAHFYVSHTGRFFVRTLVLIFLLTVSFATRASADTGLSPHEKQASELINLLTDQAKLANLYDEEANSMSRLYEERFFLHYKKRISQEDKIALVLFLREKLAQIIPPDSVQKSLAEFVVKNTSPDELAAINSFLTSAPGKKLESLRRALRAQASATGSELLSANLTRERVITMRNEIETKFPGLNIPWGD